MAKHFTSIFIVQNSFRSVFFSSVFRTFSNQNVKIDFDYLCNENNYNEIETNIRRRKGLGNIKRVRDLYKFSRTNNSLNKEHDIALNEEALKIPNKCHPITFSLSDEPKVIKEIGEKRKFTHKPFTFEDIAKRLNLLKTENITNLTGPRSYYLLDQLAELEQALISYSLSFLLKLGFELISVPDVLPRSIIEACGMNTRGDRTQVYKLEESIHGQDLCLSGTAEMGIASIFAKKKLREDDLPLKVVAVSRCFRAETSKIAEEKGIYRVHSFSKVEMFSVSSPRDSECMLEELVDIEEKLFTGLGLCLRILEMPPEELGAQAYRKKDVEAWLPGKEKWAELSSASNCTDYQSRRLSLELLESPDFPHTLNGTAAAIPRLIIAIVENYQNPDGTVTVPSQLRSHLSYNKITKSRIPIMKQYKGKTFDP